jgi:hypothetical protein
MPGNLLVAYSAASMHVATTRQYLESFGRHSSWEVRYAHVTHGARISFDINQFDAIFHSYCARLCFGGHVSPSYAAALKAFRGVKLLAVQDEYDNTNILRDAIKEFGFHVVLTCVPADYISFVYPPEMFPTTEFVTVLTGYVPEQIGGITRPAIPLAERPVVIGYRGRDIGGRYGQLGFDKYEIGRRMRQICVQRGISHDIELSEEKRIYGNAWYDFMGACRTMLGTESGSNVFDFDGSIDRAYREMSNTHGGRMSYEAFRPYVDARERQICMGQISPRIFEAAAVRTPLILFPGRYSDIIRPGEHYIELSKDFSNVDDVLAQVEDISALEIMAERTHQHLIASGKYSYERFVGYIEDIIERKRRDLGLCAQSHRAASALLRFGAQDNVEVDGGEVPTDRPRGSDYFRWREASTENARLNDLYQTEIARLNDVYQTEIARLHGVYSTEIARITHARVRTLVAMLVVRLAVKLLPDFAIQGLRKARASWREMRGS